MVARVLRAVRAWLAPITPLGWTIVVFALVVWILAARWNWEELFMMAAVALLLCVVALVFLFGRLAIRTEVKVSPARVVVGERAAGELSITNQRSRSTYGLRIELPVGTAVAPFDIARLRGNATADELFVVPTNKRAVIPCGPVTSVKGDPVGMVRRTQTWSDVVDIFVHPKTVTLPTMSAGLIRDLEGQATNALTSSDIAFHTLREYQRGDDLRHVHWKTSARMGDLMVRQYNDTRRSHVLVLLSTDTNEYTSEDEVELAISCGASVAMQSIRDGQTVTVIAGGHEIAATNPTKMLDRFSAIEPTAGVGGLATTLQAGRRLAPEASVAVIGVGSGVDVPSIRRATGRAGLQMASLVLHANLTAEPAYFAVGDVTFVSVPTLESLRRTMAAVLA